MVDFDFSNEDQDKIINLLIFDAEFLRQVVRKKIKASMFSSNVRKKLIQIIFDFYFKYNEAPEDDIETLIEACIQSKEIKEDEVDLFWTYIEKVVSINKIKKDFLLDQLDEFIKKRVVSDTTSKLIKISEQVPFKADKALEIMRDAIITTSSSIGRQPVELLSDNIEYDFSIEPLTRFNIPEFDRDVTIGAGQLALLMGFTNMGKSWGAMHLAKMAVMMGNSVLYIPVEMSNKVARQRFKMTLSGMTVDEIKANPAQVKKMVGRSMIKKSQIMLLDEEEKGMVISDMPSILEELEDKYLYKPKVIIIDSADDLEPPQGFYKSDQAKSTAKYVWLKNFAKDNGYCIITTVQANRQSKDIYWMGSESVSDDLNKARKAVLGISINGSDKENQFGFARLFNFKNTDGKVGTKAWIQQDFSRGQFAIAGGIYDKIIYNEMIKSL